jgi:hypothetical protein
MNTKKLMVAMRPNSTLIKAAVTIMIALTFGLACTQTTAYAKKKKVKYGTIEIKTNPGGFPLTIDNVERDRTSTTVQVIKLDPGPHHLDITLPHGKHWVRDFEIERARRLCLNLDYNPKTITLIPNPCPYPVEISGPVGVIEDGKLITFKAAIEYSGSRTLSYTWTVAPSAARITNGRDTDTITVDTTGLGGQRITARLAVDDGSGDAMCHQTASAFADVGKIPPPSEPECKPFDQFQSVAFDDDKARLDNLAITLQGAPDEQAYIIVYAGRTSRADQAERLGNRARDYLVNQRGIDVGRIVVVDGGCRDNDFIEIWVCPRGAKAPQPSGTVPCEPRRPNPGPRPRRPKRRLGSE